MAFVPWKKNKQIIINNVQEEDPAKSQNKSETRMTRANIVEQSNIINMNGFKSHPDHQQNYGSVGSGSVNGERTSFININRLKLFGRRGSSSTNTTTHENEDKPIDPEVDCTLRLGFPTEPPQHVQLKPLAGDHHLSAVINNYFPPNNVVPQELMQNYEVMNGTPPYHQSQPQSQHINNRFGMNNFNQSNYQLQQQIMNNNKNMILGDHGMFHGEGSSSTMNVGGIISSNNMIINNHGMFHGGGSPSPMDVGGNSSTSSSSDNSNVVDNHGMLLGSPSTMNVGGNSSGNNNNISNNMIVNNHGMFLGSSSTMNVGGNSSGSGNMIVGNHGMFHGGGSPNLIVNNHGMFHGGGIPSTMNVGRNGSINNSFGMFHGGRGGGDPSSVVVALPSPGGGTLGDGFNAYNIPHPLPPPPPNNFHVPFPNNNIPPFPQPLPAPPVFLAAPRGNGPYYQNYHPQPEPERRCFACDTTRTPLWRNGPKGPKSLCNACGIRYKKEVRRIMGAVGTDGGQQDRRNRF